MVITRRQQSSSVSDGMHRSPSAGTLLRQADAETGSVTGEIESRYVIITGITFALAALLGAALLSKILGHDTGGTYWPYISECAREVPEGPLFGFGMIVASLSMQLGAVVQFGKIKRDIRTVHQERPTGTRRNKVCLVLGLFAPPFLGLLAVFDTARSPQIHMAMVLLYFPAQATYLYSMLSVYRHIQNITPEPASVHNKAWVSLQTSLRVKSAIVLTFSIATTIYLPIGMYYVTDWYNYRNDVFIHSMRAVNQHIAVLCIILFYGSFWWDLGSTKLYLIQS